MHVVTGSIQAPFLLHMYHLIPQPIIISVDKPDMTPKNGINYDPTRSEIVHAKKLEQYNYWIDFPMDKITFLRSYKDLKFELCSK